jgi:hypothetical protein
MYNVDIIQLGNKHIRRYIYAWKQFLNNTRGRRGHGIVHVYKQQEEQNSFPLVFQPLDETLHYQNEH